MSTRAEKERFKATQEKAQAILSALLKDEDNKYCVDCDAKGKLVIYDMSVLSNRQHAVNFTVNDRRDNRCKMKRL